MSSQQRSDGRVALAEDALARIVWRRTTLVGLATRIVDALDGQAVALDDIRIFVIVERLSRRRWRRMSAERVAHEAIAALDGWHASLRRVGAAGG